MSSFRPSYKNGLSGYLIPSNILEPSRIAIALPYMRLYQDGTALQKIYFLNPIPSNRSAIYPAFIIFSWSPLIFMLKSYKTTSYSNIISEFVFPISFIISLTLSFWLVSVHICTLYDNILKSTYFFISSSLYS